MYVANGPRVYRTPLGWGLCQGAGEGGVRQGKDRLLLPDSLLVRERGLESQGLPGLGRDASGYTHPRHSSSDDSGDNLLSSSFHPSIDAKPVHASFHFVVVSSTHGVILFLCHSVAFQHTAHCWDPQTVQEPSA